MHKPVLYQQVLDALQIRKDGIYLDGTFGRGGHAAGILSLLGQDGQLLACDRDKEALDHAESQELFQRGQCRFFHCTFAEVFAHIEAAGLMGRLDGILLDLGLSSPQIDNPQRGFSFQGDGPLDMRMDQQQPMDASAWLAQVSEQELADVLWRFGEERYSRRIARSVVSVREQQAIKTTKQLVDIVTKACPKKDKHKHPATRTFQAIRIKINAELQQLTSFLDQALDLLAPGGRLVVISFHSLEDRIVKQWMRAQANPDQTPSKLPVLADACPAHISLISRKPIVADAEEICHNPRARSAKMRVAEKCYDQQANSGDISS